MFARYSGRSERALRSATAVKSATTSALELDKPEARGRSLARATSAPRSLPGKLRARRPATVSRKTLHPLDAGTTNASRAISALSRRAACATRTSLAARPPPPHPLAGVRARCPGPGRPRAHLQEAPALAPPSASPQPRGAEPLLD